MKSIKICTVLIAVLMMLTLIGCGANAGASSSNQSAGSKDGQTSEAAQSTESQNAQINEVTQSPEQQAVSGVKVGLIIATNGLGDKSINDQSNTGLKKAASELGVETKLMEPKDASQFADMEQELAESGYNVIINDTLDMSDAVSQAADTYKDVQFVIMDTVIEKENVLSVIFATDAGSFLAGAAAALKSETGTIGFVGGMEIPTIQKFLSGYEQGAKYVNPDINVLVKYIGDDNTVWSDVAKGKALAEELAGNGADVVYHAAGGSGLGVIEGCQEKNIWAIGVNIDQEEVAPATVLTSMLTNGDVAILEAVNSYMNNGTAGKTLVMNLENDGVGLVMSDNLSDDEKARLAEIKQNIVDVKIKITDATASGEIASALQ